MLKEIRKNYRRLIAFLLSAAMIITNVGGNAGTVFAAEEREVSLFMADGQNILEAVSGVKDQEPFSREDLDEMELDAKQKSAVKKFEKLLLPEDGKVYELELEIDSDFAVEGTDLRVFYCAKTEEVIFLFLNESSQAVDCCVNIDGYETKLVTVGANANAADTAELEEESQNAGESEEESEESRENEGASSSGGASSGGSSGGSSSGSSSSGGSSGGSLSGGASSGASDEKETVNKTDKEESKAEENQDDQEAADKADQDKVSEEDKDTAGSDTLNKEDNSAKEEDEAVDEDKPVNEDTSADKEENSSTQDKADASEDKADTSEDKADASEDKADASQDKADASEDKADTSEDKGSNEGSADKSDSASDSSDSKNESSDSGSDSSKDSSSSDKASDTSDKSSSSKDEASSSSDKSSGDSKSESSDSSSKDSSSNDKSSSDNSSSDNSSSDSKSDSSDQEKSLSVSYHKAAIAAVALDDLQDAAEADEEETEAETTAEETEEVIEESVEDSEAETEESEKETEIEPETTAETETVEGTTAAVEESTTAGVETDSKDENIEEGLEETTAADKTETTEESTAEGESQEGTEAEETTQEETEETLPEDSKSAEEESKTTTESADAEETTTEVSGENASEEATDNAEEAGDGDVKESDELGDDWEIPGKAYDAVTIQQTMTARAYCVKLEDVKKAVELNLGVELEETQFHVEYQMNLEDAAEVIGDAYVAEGEDLYFAVKAKEGFEVAAVYANGSELEAITDFSEVEDASNWENYSYVYAVVGVGEAFLVEIELEDVTPVIAAATYTAETDDAVFTVDVPDGAFAEEVELKVSKIENKTELKTFTEQANEALTADRAVASVRAYDISFISEKSGEELEPAETVSVNIRFKESAVAKDVSDEEVKGLSVVHLPENGDAQVMTSVDSGKETEMEFRANSFSVYVVTADVEAAASNGEKGFATMQEAIDAAEDEDTIILKKAIAENVTIVDKKITIDTNGQTWLSKNNGSTTGVSSIITVSDSTLTLIGNGKISGVSISGSEYKELGLGWITNGNIKYRTITATNTHLIIGEEGEEGPTIEGYGNTQYSLSEEVSKTKGGAILVENGSLVMNSGTVQKGTLGGGSTSYGAGIAVVGGDGFTMNGGTITQNVHKKSGTRYGGGVSVEKANFTMNGGEISENTSGSYGGGVYVAGSSTAKAQVKIENGVITKNTSGSYGGGVYVAGSSTAKAQVKIENGVITKNTCGSYGGGLYVTYCEVTTDNATFSENKASNFGGGVFAYFSTEMTFNNSKFTDNTAGNRGAGICSHSYNNQSLTINGCTITGNRLTKALTFTVGGGICDESTSGNLEIGGNTVITNNEIAGGKGGGVYALKKKGNTLSFGEVTIANNEASQGGGVAIDTGAGSKALTAANKPTIVITDETKVYGNCAKDDNAIAGTSAHVSDEFLFFNRDSDCKKTGFDNHVVTVGMDEYTLVNGGDSNVETKDTSRGYYNYQESNLTKDDCINNGDVYLDPEKKAELYIWLTDENGKEHGEKLTEDNGLCTNLKDAYEAAMKEGASGKVYICSTVVLTQEDNRYLENANITYMRYKTFQSGYMFSVKGGESVTFNGAHVDGCGIETDSAMIECGLNSTLTIAGETILENANNINKQGGAVKVHGNSYNRSEEHTSELQSR